MKKPSAENTYCNPLPIPDLPRAADNWSDPTALDGTKKGEPSRRSIGDPTVMYYDNKWYLYPSYGMAWVSEDFASWKHVRTEPYCPKYSPAIIPWHGKFLLCFWKSPLYVADHPLGPFTLLGDFYLPDGTPFAPCDPALFCDDDGRLYLYANSDSSIQIVGYELDSEHPQQVLRGPVALLKMNPEEHVWERFGQHNQDARFGWVEGAHLIKYRGRYYLIYATPGTEYASYAMAVCYSDDGPLSGFQYQKRNPLTIHTEGIVKGAGHGSVERGPGDTLWAFYTVSAAFSHEYERRIGMDLVAVDENGELYCPYGVTDTPQYVPGYRKDPVSEGNEPGLLSLTGWCRPTVSSSVYGREGLYATDESSITWWEPAPDDPQPTITCNLFAEYDVCACRLFWHEVGLDYEGGVLPGAFQYMLEGYHQGQWMLLLDRRNATEDLNIDYRTFVPACCSRVRLTVTGHPVGIRPGIIDFTVFGMRSQADSGC